MPRPAGHVPQRLGPLVRRVGADIEPAGDAVLVTGITLDSRSVRPGDLYAALPGVHRHGADFVADALDAGAVAVLSDHDLDVPVPVVVVADPRAVLGKLSSAVYGDPSSALSLIGVTGTNGKTTTAYLVEAGLRGAGRSTGLLGTVTTRIGDQDVPSVRTTPEAPELQALLAVMRERGVQGVAMEVSSHALSLGRVDGTTFAAGVFTNLGEDHLDFHADVEAYFQAKASLFRPERVATAVLNVDDPAGTRLMEIVRVPQVTVSAAGEPWADWRAQGVVSEAWGSTLTALGPAGERVEVRVGLPGRFNVANALAALAALVATGVPADAAAVGLAGLTGVPGRMERIDAGQPFTALVDYAHTPEAVVSLLAAVRELTPGRLVVVLGCGGDRDRGKRPRMARAAVDGSDAVVFTSDNPRSEDPLRILADMTTGLRAAFQVEVDRGQAIALAAHGLGPGDTLVVAGKGHETGQEIAGETAPFDDRAALRAVLDGLASP